jgi:glutamate racemase
MNPGPIGIFDSGLGGLTVVHAVHRHLPRESTLYFGDTARVPYGPKSPDTVRRYSLEILEWLLGLGVKAVVVACNTSTAHALDALAARSPVPVLGVIEPGARAAVRASPAGPIGVIGTAGTVASRAYPRAIAALAPGARVLQQACPLFVPLVEEGWFEHPATLLVAREYLEPLLDEGIEALVLGCTHYPLLVPVITEIAGPEVCLVDSAEETALALGALLEDGSLGAPGDREPLHRYVVSDDPGRFDALATRFLGERARRAEVHPWP